MFTNADALDAARRLYYRKLRIAKQAIAKIPQPVHKEKNEKGEEITVNVFDTRHPLDIAALVIDTSNVPEDQQDEYIRQQAEEIAKAFFTVDEKTHRPYPEAVKPYIKKVYDNMTVNTNIDWNDPVAVERILATYKASQSFATLVKDFPDFVFDLYPDVADIRKIDDLSSKATLIVNDAQIAWDNNPDPYRAEEENVRSYAIPNVYGTLDTRLMSEVGHPVFDARIADSNVVMLDALASDFTKKHFLGIEFDEEFGQTFCNSDEYAKMYLEKLANNHMRTSVEQFAHTAMSTATEDPMIDYERLFINGKSIRESIREMQEGQEMSGFSAQVAAGKMLRDALTDGKSIVTMMQVVSAKGGKTEFRHQEIKVDLNKLNKVDKEENNYGRFRRFLDRIGIWKIQKFKTNEARDAAQAKARSNPELKAALRAAEDKYIKTYNSEETQKAMERRNPRMAAVFSKLVRADEVDKSNQLENAPVSTEPVRVPMTEINLEETKDIAIQPKIETEDKVLNINKVP